jgi:EF-P beta-lysylation protein EpmB
MPPLTLQSDDHAAKAALDRTVADSLPVGNEGGTVASDRGQASTQPPPPEILSESHREVALGSSWQAQLADAIRDVDELWRVLSLPAAALPAAKAAAGSFRLMVPRSFVARMRPGDLADPLLRQVVPLGEEMQDFPGFTADPLSEATCAPTAGVLHKYLGRALLVTTGACAVHCRYCFRRHYPYDDLPRGRRWWGPAIDYLTQHADISEVLLSGGDPLTLPDAQLSALADELAGIPHLRRLRIHTRLPIVLPARVTPDFISWFTAGRLAPVMVVHVNHPRELSPEVIAACRRLRAAGVTMLSQAVLLAGVNDEAEVLCGLSEGLFAAGVIPYYLHQLDRVQGAGHFLVDDQRAVALMRTIAARLPGYLVPRLVREIADSPGKTPIRW